MQDNTQPTLSTNSILTDKISTRPHEDSQISTSTDSSNASSRNPSLSHWHDSKEGSITSPEDTKFPMWTKANKNKTKSNSHSFKDDELVGETVTEEGEEEEEGENQIFKKLPVVADGEEFNVKKTHINRFGRRENIFSKDLSRCRSLDTSFLPLDSVAEDKNEEERDLFKQRRKFKLQSFKVEDLNEFNRGCLSDRGSFERKNTRNMSMKLKGSKEVIVEEQENRVLPHLQSVFATYSSGSSRRGSLMTNSPGTKLKVDEIDMWGKPEANKEDSDENEIDTIMEETEEKNGQENKQFQHAIAKLNEEREFVKKVVKGDIIDENTSVLIKRSSEREYSFHGNDATGEIIEEDNNENLGN